jgi:DNA-binding HxlR family transcriptional regulator
MLILRDIGMRNIQRFNRLLVSVGGITPRVLSQRLRELEQEGYIECIEKRSPMLVRWGLTEKGKDTLPILMSFIAFGSKWYADEVFEDKKPRTLSDLFKTPQAREVIERYARAQGDTDSEKRPDALGLEIAPSRVPGALHHAHLGVGLKRCDDT